jgi:hypothetical protein
MSRKPVGINDRMNLSIGHFEHQGMFSLAIDRIIDKEMRKNILMHLGCTGAGSIESYSSRCIEFDCYLHSRGIVSEDKKTNWSGYESTTIVENRDATKLKDAAMALGYVALVQLCNKWMGLDENDGVNSIMQQSQAQTNESPINQWCKQNNIEFMIPILDNNGFDAFDDLKHITDDDLIKMGVDKLGHQKRVRRAIDALN